MSERRRIVHISTAHRPLDVRIFEKECRSLAAAGFEVHFVVPDAPSTARDGVHFHAIAKPQGGFRPFRIVRRLANAYHTARALDGALYHFHDCELILVGTALKLGGAKVVYDVHEHFPFEAFSINKGRPLRGISFFLIWSALETVARLLLDGFVPATPYIARRFPQRRTALAQNFPLRADYLEIAGPVREARAPHLAYAGGISRIRGLREIVEALALLPADSPIRLRLLGEFSDAALEAELRSLPGWRRVDYLGFQPRDIVIRHLGQCSAGLVLFHPERDHIDAQPNKLFEYMAAGLPVIASNFPLWRKLVEDSGCGVTCDPLDIKSIAATIQRVALDPAAAASMGERGREAVLDTVNWEHESRQLLALYERILGPGEEETAGFASPKIGAEPPSERRV
jgi:glycosyltransferase involved in cell wall biosynthesis